MKTNNELLKDKDQEVSGAGSVGETDSPYEVLDEVDKLLAEHGLEIEMLDFKNYYSQFRIVRRLS